MVDPIKSASRGVIEKIGVHYPMGGAQAPSLSGIGKPCSYHYTIDPNHRISEFFKGRMNVIDLLPCHYKIDFSKVTEADNDSSGLVPQIVYGKAMGDFASACGSHGVGGGSGLRIYTIDDTQASDSISNELKENYFQSGINKLSEIGSPIRQFMKSVDSNSVSGLSSEVTESFDSSEFAGQSPIVDKVYSMAKDVIIKGNRVSLPSIWKDSSYSPNLTANIRLASPYGHPDAISTFVINPLAQLLIISSPQTTDGVSYGQPFFLTIHAHGLSYSPLGIISNITLRRGGNDTSFNIYRQPLTIDVSLEFQFAVGGFAHASGDCGGNADTTALPTVGHIMKSLAPSSGVGVGYSAIAEARNTKPDGSQNNDSTDKTPNLIPESDPLDNSNLSKNDIASSQDVASLASSSQTANNINNQQSNPNVGDTFA